MKHPLYLILILVLFITACQKDALNPLDYLNYVHQKNSGFQVQEEGQTCTYELKYLPIEYQIARDLQRSPNLEIAKLQERYEGHHYFNLSIKNKDGKGISKCLEKSVGQEQVEKTLNDLNFKAKDNFALSIGQDTLPCVLYHLEREQMPGLGMQYTLVFQEQKESTTYTDNFKLSYQNEALEKEGVHFTIKKENINNRPQLKF